MKLTQLKEAKYAYPNPHDEFTACGYCGEESSSIGYGDETFDFCHNCERDIEGHTIIRRLNVRDEFGMMNSDWENVE